MKQKFSRERKKNAKSSSHSQTRQLDGCILENCGLYGAGPKFSSHLLIGGNWDRRQSEELSNGSTEPHESKI